MPSRYPQSTRIQQRFYGTSEARKIVRALVKNKSIGYHVVALQESERLDIVAQRHYGDSSLWWVIAAASGIGWGLQVPAGTHLIIPKEVSRIITALG